MKKSNIDIRLKKSDRASQTKCFLSFGKRVREIGFLFIFLCSYIGFAQQTPKVKAKIDTTNIRIGEQFQYKLTVDGIENVILPKLENLTGVEIIDSARVDTIKNQLIQKFVLTSFDSGAYYIPQQQVFIKNRAYLTDSLLINVATVAVDTTQQPLYPIKAIFDEPVVLDDFKPYLWWAVLVLVIIGFLVYYFVFRKKKEEKEEVIIPALPPYEEAMEKLKELDGKLLWQNNQVKKYYSELTDIVRSYIERELKVPALESTTDELIETLSDFEKTETIVTTKETIVKLKKLLQEADLVKFAKSKPLAEEIEGDRKVAEDVVNNLKPKPIVEDDEVE